MPEIVHWHDAIWGGHDPCYDGNCRLDHYHQDTYGEMEFCYGALCVRYRGREAVAVPLTVLAIGGLLVVGLFAALAAASRR